MRLTSPVNGAALVAAGPSALSDGQRRWPVVAGIPYLRTGRDDLRAAALSALDRGDERRALVLLLRDQDDWAPDPPPAEHAVRALLDGAPSGSWGGGPRCCGRIGAPSGSWGGGPRCCGRIGALSGSWGGGPRCCGRIGAPTLREAMDRLAFGPVADYFAYRWSDPTWLAGLALLDAHWTAPRTAFEVACGIGHYSRELARRGVATAGGDVVFAKLWLALRYVSPTTTLLCFDAAAPWPLPDRAADLALCHDALYFLPNKPHVARELARVAPAIVVGHAHNAEVENLSAGEPLTAPGYAALFTDPTCYDDAELTAALLAGRLPEPAPPERLRGCEAVGLATGAPRAREAGTSGLPLPPPGTRLRRNPLLTVGGGGAAVVWPSPRYAAEYGARSGYLTGGAAPAEAVAGVDATIDALARRRLLVDLPERW